MRSDVISELKELRLRGMVSAWQDLTAQGDTGIASSRTSTATRSTSR